MGEKLDLLFGLDCDLGFLTSMDYDSGSWPLEEERKCEGGITGKSARRCGVEDSDDDEMGRG